LQERLDDFFERRKMRPQHHAHRSHS
jgi:hypothetical protein